MVFSKKFTDEYRVLSGSALKIIAVISMFLDHFALVFSDADSLNFPVMTFANKTFTLYYILRKLGRIAFPLFCFLVAEGFFYTKNPKKYLATLLTFAVISEIPYNLMLGNSVFFDAKQNVYFTLFLAAALLFIFTSSLHGAIKGILGVLIVVGIPFLRIDYGVKGVLLIVFLYALRDKKIYQILASLPFLSGGYAAWFGMFLTALYNGQRGFIKGKSKYAFYLFYPAHILLLVFLKRIV